MAPPTAAPRSYPLGRDCTVAAYLNASHVAHLGTELAALVALKDRWVRACV
jgi:hypothetical protein